MHTGPCPRRKPWPASRSMIGKAVSRLHRARAVFQPRAGNHLTSRLPLEDSAAGTARRASRGCRQVFGLWARRHPPSPCPSLPRLPLASQCIDGFVPIYRCGAVLEWPWQASPASLFILPTVGWARTDDHKIRCKDDNRNTRCWAQPCGQPPARLARQGLPGDGRRPHWPLHGPDSQAARIPPRIGCTHAARSHPRAKLTASRAAPAKVRIAVHNLS